MRFSNLYNKILIDIELNVFDDDKNYEKLSKLYKDTHENNELLIQTIKEYDFQPENRGKRNFINTLLKILLDNNLLGENISKEIESLIYQKINKMLGISKIKGEYLEFSVLFRLSPKKEDIVKIEENFDLTHYLYGYFLRYYFSKKDYGRFCKSLKIYLDKYFEDLDDNKFFIFSDSDYESWFEIDKIANTFLKYFIDNFDELINLILNYQVYSSSIELLCKNSSSDLVQKFLKLLFNEYLNKHNFRLESHIRGEELEKIVRTQNDDTEFCEYIFDKISSGEFQAFDIGFYVLKGIITEDNINQFFGYNWEDYIVLNLYYLYTEEDNIGQKIYKKYKKIIDNNKQRNEQHRALEKKNKLEKEKEIKEKIRILIKENVKNKKKKYPCREIIYLYNDYPDLFSEKEKEFVKNNIEFYFSCDEINLRNVQTEVIKQGENSFRIPRFLRDLVLCVKIAENLGINLSNYVSLLTGLIPYLFDGELRKIFDVLLKLGVVELGNDDIEWLINIYLNNQHKDLSKFHITRIPHLISKGFINFSKLSKEQKKEIYQIYKNNLEVENVPIREKKIFLESILEIGEFDKIWLYNEYNNIFQQFMNYNYYEDYLLGNMNIEQVEDYEKFLKLNEILIVLYKDKNCIRRRLNQLKGIKTSYIRKSMEIHGLTKRDDEFFWSKSKNERFYTCIINAIDYPDYISDIKDILGIANDFGAEEGSYIKPYIYDFCLEYFKKTPTDKQLDEIIGINDEIFVKRYFFNILDEENKKEYKIFEMGKFYINNIHGRKNLEEYNKEIGALYEENQYLKQEIGKKDIEIDENKQENKLLKEKIKKDSLEIFLYVEGKTDQYYIESALYNLKKFQSLNIMVINCCGFNNIQILINSFIVHKKTGIHIGIFDFDMGGLDGWINSNSENAGVGSSERFWEQNIVFENIFENKYKISGLHDRENSFYSLLLLPYTANFKNQIFYDDKCYNIVDSGKTPKSFLVNNGVLINKLSSPVFSIEHLLYCEETEKYFKKVPVIGGGTVKVIESKIPLYNAIKGNNILPSDIWKNFSPIFEYVQNVYNEFQNKFNVDS